MITSNELELRSTLTLGTLESNAEAIRDLVLSKLEDYTAANYIGKAAEAKQDRAVLNNAEKALNAKRLELERSYMEPFNKFKATITETCKAIKEASAGLDEIVKAEENRERDEKKKQIQEYWDATGFSLFPLEKVYNEKWTNKTTKYKDVTNEIDAIQKRTFDELKILENFPAQDVPLLKNIYLETLNITDAMNKANQMKENRDRLAKEATEREAIEKRNSLAAQRAQETKDINEACAEEAISDLAAEALGLDITQEAPAETEEYAVVFKGTRDQLLEIRRFMTKTGVTYTKLEDKGNGVYTAETKAFEYGVAG